jgi:hypothetical protein
LRSKEREKNQVLFSLRCPEISQQFYLQAKQKINNKINKLKNLHFRSQSSCYLIKASDGEIKTKDIKEKSKRKIIERKFSFSFCV